MNKLGKTKMYLSQTKKRLEPSAEKGKKKIKKTIRKRF